MTKWYSLLRGIAIAIDLHQLGKPEIHDTYAPIKVVYGNLSQGRKTTWSGSSLSEWACRSANSTSWYEPPTPAAEGSTTTVLGTVLIAASMLHQFTSTHGLAYIRYCSILDQGADHGRVLGSTRQGYRSQHPCIAANLHMHLPCPIITVK